MINDEILTLIDPAFIKKILSSDILCEKLQDFDTYFNNNEYDKDDYLTAIDYYVYDMINHMKLDFKPLNFGILSRYFKYFVNNRYESFQDYFANPVINDIHKINVGNFNRDVLNFFSVRNSTSYLENLSALNKYYDDIISSDTDIDVKTFSRIFDFYGSGKLENNEVKRYHCDYVFSKLLDDKYKDMSFDVELFKYYFKHFTDLVAKENKLPCICRIEYIPPSNNKIRRAMYEFPPINTITLNSSLFGDTMSKNIPFFDTIFHELSHCSHVTKSRMSYNYLRIVKDSILKEVLGNKYYSDNYKLISMETEAELHSKLDSLHYFRNINSEFYNKIITNSINDVIKRIKSVHTNIRYNNGYPYSLDELFEKTLDKKLKQFYIGKHPILNYEYFNDGTRKLPIDLIAAKNYLINNDNNNDNNNDSLKMTNVIIKRQDLSLEEIISTYCNSFIPFENDFDSFENERLAFLTGHLLKSLKMKFYTIDNSSVLKIEEDIIKTLVGNILSNDSCINDNIESNKLKCLNIRIKDDLVILDSLIKCFKSYNKVNSLELNLSKLIENDIKKEL